MTCMATGADKSVIDSVRMLAADRSVRVSIHARREMDEDRVGTDDMLHAIALPSSEMIEDYPDDPRGHSMLVLAWTNALEPIPVCCAVHEETLIIITVYRPSETRWHQDWRTRK